MFRHKFMRATVWLTMLSVIMAVSSLLLPWYNVTNGSETSSGYIRYSTVEFSLDHFIESGAMEDYDREYEDVGSLMGLTAFLVGLWALLAMVYVFIIIPNHEEYPEERYDGVALGFVIVTLSLATVFNFAALIAGSCECGHTFVGSNELDKWGPMSGWFVALLACVVQTLAVMARNVPALKGTSKESRKDPSDDLPHGDLPAR